MNKQIKRTYYSKKLDKYVTKIYNYSGKSRRGLTLVGKNGKITANSKKNVEAFEKWIKNNPTYNDAEKRTLINDLRARVLVYHQNHMKLTSSGFMGAQQDDSITRLLTNLGYTSQELADEYDLPESAILNAENWQGDTFSWNGLIFQINFTYTGSVFMPVL